MLSFTQPLKGMAEFEEIEKSLEKNQGIVQITGCLESQKAHLIHVLSGKTPMSARLRKSLRTCAFMTKIPCFTRRRIFSFSRQIFREIC